jgi:hypothetical protein
MFFEFLVVDLIDNLHFHKSINNQNNLHFHRSSTITAIQSQNARFNKHTINLYNRYEQSMDIKKHNLYTDYKIRTKNTSTSSPTINSNRWV